MTKIQFIDQYNGKNLNMTRSSVILICNCNACKFIPIKEYPL